MNAFAAILFASLLSRLGYQMARSPVLPSFAADLGALPELIGIIVAASTITGVFFKLPAGALSDVLGRKRMMVLGALFFAAPPFLYPFVHDAWSLLALRFVHGFATAIFSPVASAYVASLAETERGARLGWFSSANDIGATAGPLMGGFVLYFTASYSATYLTVGARGGVPAGCRRGVQDTADFRRGRHRSRHVPRLRRLSRLPADLREEGGAQRRGDRDRPRCTARRGHDGEADHRTRVRSGGANTGHRHRPPALRCRASADLPERKPDGFRPCSAAAWPGRRRGHAGYQCAYRRPRLGTAPRRRHGRVRNHLGHR